MYTSPTMSFGDSIVISLLGILIVFSVLVVLALAVKAVSNLVAGFSATAKPAQKAATVQKAAPVDDTENEMQAAVIAALCEELHTTPDRLTVNYIKAI